MTLIKEINLLENKKMILWLNIVSIPLLFLFFVLFLFISIQVGGPTVGSFEFDLFTIIVNLVVLFMIITIHEGIHGIFFKIFNPNGKVKYGFKNGMAYATSPNSFYTKGKFAWICLAPFFIITLSLFLLFYFGIIRTPTFVLTASLHAAACIGDFYWTYLIIKLEKNAYIEDTEVGIRFYRKDSLN